MKYPLPLQKLIDYFAQLPTVGPKTAERYVFYLLKQSPEQLREFGQAIIDLPQQLTICQHCQAVAASSPCPICADRNRQTQLLCLVADTQNMMAMEATNQYHGYYHILGGTLDLAGNSSLSQANLRQLMEKIDKEKITEVILAFNPDVAGDTTAIYLTKLLKPAKIKITRLAQGLPIGANLEYADPATLAQALKFRNIL